MKYDNINKLAYLNTLESNKKPLDLLLEIIQIECYIYDFNELGIITKDKKSIRNILKEKYNLEIEEYVLKKIIESKFMLDNEKLKLKSEKFDLGAKIKNIKEGEEKFLNSVSKIQSNFIEFCSKEYNKKVTNEEAKNVFNDYIYTVARYKDVENDDNQLYFIFQNFLKYLYKNNNNDLEIVENLGIANQIQDLVINGEDDDPKFLNQCIIFLDTPIIMKRLGYDGKKLADTYKLFFDDLREAGAELKIFEHTFDELWGILFNFKRCIAQNILDAKGVNTFLRARKEYLNAGEELSLDKKVIEGNIRKELIEILDISTEDNIAETKDFSNWVFDPEKFKKVLLNVDSNYKNYKSRLEKDIQSVFAIARLRQRLQNNQIYSYKDARYFLLVDNYALIKAIHNYYEDSDAKVRKNELLLENTIIFNLWQNLTNNSSLNKALFRSKCFALNTINDSFKYMLYRETRRIEAYSDNVNINYEIIDDPELEEKVYAQSIRDKKFDKDYISKVIQNKVTIKKEADKKFYEEIVRTKVEQLKQMRIDREEDKNKYLLDLQQKDIDNEKKKQEYLLNFQVETILKKIEEMERKFKYKLIICFCKYRKNFDKKKYLWDEACKITNIQVIYDPQYFINE